MTRPNLLFLLADDMGAWALGCAGNPEVRTPNLDRLAAHGVRLTNAFCVSPVCSPARASLLTGQLPSRHGVLDWIRRGNSSGESPDGAVIDYLGDRVTYTERLAAHGYTVGLSGKWHLGNAPTPHRGHAFWEVHARGGSAYYGAPMIENGREVERPEYVTDVITGHALTFLRDQPHDAPFYLGVHYTAPHSPWNREEHPPEWFDLYHQQCPLVSTPDLPLHPDQIASSPTGETPEKRRENLSGYYAAISAMDAAIGRLLDELEHSGRLENTLIIFTSDNGMNMGHHGIWGKGNGTYPLNLFDTSVKVPFLVSWPEKLPSGRVSEALFSHYDFFPSLFHLLGLESAIPDGLPGRDRSGIWRGEPVEEESEVVVFDEYGPARMIRTSEWKYIARFPDGPDELYHLAQDPDEAHNRLADPACAAMAQSLAARLTDWFTLYTEAAADGRTFPVCGMGQRDRLDSRTAPLFDGPARRVRG